MTSTDTNIENTIATYTDWAGETVTITRQTDGTVTIGETDHGGDYTEAEAIETLETIDAPAEIIDWVRDGAVTVTVDRQAGTIKVEDTRGTESGMIRIIKDESGGWTRTNLDGQRVAISHPDREQLIGDTITMLREGASCPVGVREVAR